MAHFSAAGIEDWDQFPDPSSRITTNPPTFGSILFSWPNIVGLGAWIALMALVFGFQHLGRIPLPLSGTLAAVGLFAAVWGLRDLLAVFDLVDWTWWDWLFAVPGNSLALYLGIHVSWNAFVAYRSSLAGSKYTDKIKIPTRAEWWRMFVEAARLWIHLVLALAVFMVTAWLDGFAHVCALGILPGLLVFGGILYVLAFAVSSVRWELRRRGIGSATAKANVAGEAMRTEQDSGAWARHAKSQ